MAENQLNLLGDFLTFLDDALQFVEIGLQLLAELILSLRQHLCDGLL